MKGECACEYSALCRRMEMVEQPQISYWPRNHDLSPYCKSENDPKKCAVHSYWDENPKSRERTENHGNPDALTAYGSVALAIGQFLTWGPVKSAPMAVIASLLGVYSVAEGLSRRYNAKGFLRWLKTRKDKEATGEIYQRILERLDSLDDIEAGPEEIFGFPQIADSLVNNISMVESPIAGISGAKSASWNKTNFMVGKLHLSYPLTHDFTLNSETDVGVVLSYKYEKRHCDSPDCSDTITNYYATGILSPIISKKKIRKETSAFIEGMINQNMPPMPVPVAGDAGIGIGIATSTLTGITTVVNKLDNVFGDPKKIDGLIKSARMDEKTAMDVRNVHRLMQEVLYSEF